uniref:Reticulocalbin-3 n=1 Tax=Ciona savignyi TaxID=51511 RepID=H2ZJY8_CIOSA
MLREVLFLYFVYVAFALEHKDRVIDSKLSDKEFGTADYDHDAFLGKETAAEMDELSPEESKRRLAIIITKVDKNGDGIITEKEMKDWIRFTHQRYIREDSDKRFMELMQNNGTGMLHWNAFKHMVYGYGEDGQIVDEIHETEEYRKQFLRDERRWKRADLDGDNQCTIEEFRIFSHPEEFRNMSDLVVQETIEDMDKNDDGSIDLEEYIKDMFNPENGEPEPDWVRNEREHFNIRDTNSNGKMDAEEVMKWILPEDYDHAESQAMHLIFEADDDK